MAEVLLPRFVVAQKCLPGGWRQSRKPEIPRPAFMAPPVKAIESLTGIPDIVGFAGWEYRFWAAVQSEDNRSVIAECRGCMSIFSDPIARKEHLGRMGCSVKLTAAYKLLLKDKICVICNMHSYQEKWGVPICSKSCVEAWCKVESQPDALKLALTLVGDGR